MRIRSYRSKGESLIFKMRRAIDEELAKGMIVEAIELTDDEYDIYRAYVGFVSPISRLGKPRQGPLRFDEYPVIRENEREP